MISTTLICKNNSSYSHKNIYLNPLFLKITCNPILINEKKLIKNFQTLLPILIQTNSKLLLLFKFYILLLIETNNK